MRGAEVQIVVAARRLRHARSVLVGVGRPSNAAILASMFNYWIGAGRIDVAFLGAAQVDRFANLNSTVIGDYADPLTRLPGAGGAPEIAASCGEVMIICPHAKRTLVERLDFVTTVGFGDGP